MESPRTVSLIVVCAAAGILLCGYAFAHLLCGIAGSWPCADADDCAGGKPVLCGELASFDREAAAFWRREVVDRAARWIEDAHK